MNVFMIIIAVCIVAIAWFWHNKPVRKGAPARTWPAGRGKMGVNSKITQLK
jgi:hypothetical protein